MNRSENYQQLESASILCLGLGWFPTSPGGLERYVYELTHQLTTKGDRVELCGVGLPPQTSNPHLKLTNLAAPDTSILSRLQSCRRQFRATRGQEKPDAINLHFALYASPILDLLPKDVPITFNFHGPWVSESQEETDRNKLLDNLKRWLIEQRTYNRCDRFIVLSKAFGTILHQEYHIPWSKIHIIPGAAETERFAPTLSPQAAREKLGWHTERPILYTARRLVQRVGLDKLINAVAQIKTQIPDIWLAIAGRGYLQETLEAQVQALGLEDNIKFVGFLPDGDLPIAYQAANLTIMPSQSFEGFGLAIVESLACGTPVICTPIGGMPEILTPFSPQLITSSTNENAIATTIIDALQGKIPIPSRNQCREYALSHFTWEKVAEDIRKVLLMPK
ncbi:group 1 glycosyl transferase [Calothrix sp. NIES-3974]|nr:group 1 glycosyl transferase [Calothrix sp. NIES-3974]